MAYLDVITLEDAKHRIRIDEDFDKDDKLIERLIKSALQYVENSTNHLFFEREIDYVRYANEKRIVVFDYPINEDLSELKTLYFPLRHEFDEDKLTLSVGYDNTDDIPQDLIEAAYKIIDNWYYDFENEGDEGKIPMAAREIIWRYRRAIVA